MRNANILIMAVTIMDLVTALIIFIYPKPLVVARLGIFYEVFSSPLIGAFLMFLAVILAGIGLAIPRSNRWRFLWFIPQQFFLLLTTGSAIDFVVMGHYADGVQRAWQFILQDQLPTIMLTFAYGFAIFDYRKGHNGQ